MLFACRGGKAGAARSDEGKGAAGVCRSRRSCSEWKSGCRIFGKACMFEKLGRGVCVGVCRGEGDELIEESIRIMLM